MYERNGVYVFDAWVKRGPGAKEEMNRSEGGEHREKVTERSVAASRCESGSPSGRRPGVRIQEQEAEEIEYEVKEEEKGWKKPKKGKTIAKSTQKLFAQSYSRGVGRSNASGDGHCDGGPCCNEDDYESHSTVRDDGYWSDFIRRVPNWP